MSEHYGKRNTTKVNSRRMPVVQLYGMQLYSVQLYGEQADD